MAVLPPLQPLHVRLRNGGGDFVPIAPGEASYQNLLKCYKQRHKFSPLGGWTKHGRCEWVAKEAFEQLKRIDINTAGGEMIRRQIAKVIEDDVIPHLGETNRLAHQVDTRIDNAGIFNKTLQYSSNLSRKKGLEGLGPITYLGQIPGAAPGAVGPGIQAYDKNGAPVVVGGVPVTQTGYLNIWGMTSSEVNELEAKLKDFEKEIENVDPKILKAMTFDREDFYHNVNTAKAQLKIRKEWLKSLASGLPTRLVNFRREARAIDRVADMAARVAVAPVGGGGPAVMPPAGPLQTALTQRADQIKADLNAVEELYKNISAEDRNWIAGQMDQLTIHGKCPRSKKALSVNLQEPMLSVEEVAYGVGTTVILGAALNGAPWLGGTLGTVGNIIEAVANPASAIIGLGVVAYMQYQRGGWVAELFE